MRIAASLTSLLAGCASFLLVTAALRPTLGGGDESDSRSEIKFREYARHKDEYDTLILGSSRAFRGFDPQHFDRLMEDAGTPTRAFNFGIPGARVMEIDRLLERIAALRPARLRWLLVDPERLEVLVDDENALSRPVIDWHDLRRTRVICSYALRGQRGWLREWRRIEPHVVACAYNLVGVGRGLALCDLALGSVPDPDWVADTLGPRKDGFPVLGTDRARHRRFLRTLDDYHALLADYRELELDDGPAAPEALEMFDSLAERAERLGARLVLLTQPGLFLEDDLIKAADSGRVATLLRYDDPDAVPELYAPEARFDSNHLNGVGALAFTGLLARDLQRLARESEREP